MSGGGNVESERGNHLSLDEGRFRFRLKNGMEWNGGFKKLY